MTILTTDWAPHIERYARNIAAVIAAVYVAGYVLGAWIHQLNDDVAAVLAPRPKMPAPAVHPLFELASELEQLTCKELRAMTAAPRKAVKAQLVTLASLLA